MDDGRGAGPLHAAIDELYAADPDEFVLVRSRLERALRTAGEPEAAAEIHRRRRPHLAAWACNQLARRDRDAIAALLEVTERVAEAQHAAVTGGNGETLRDTARRRQSALDELTDAGVRLLRGHAPKPDSYRDNIVATLDAASIDPELAPALRAGCLTHALPPPSGFGPRPVPATTRTTSAAARQRPTRRERERAQRALEQARRQVASLRGELEDATAEHTSAGIEAQSAAGHVRDVEQALERAREAERRAVNEAETRRARAEALQRELEDAVERAGEAENRVRELTDD